MVFHTAQIERPPSEQTLDQWISCIGWYGVGSNTYNSSFHPLAGQSLCGLLCKDWYTSGAWYPFPHHSFLMMSLFTNLSETTPAKNLGERDDAGDRGNAGLNVPVGRNDIAWVRAVATFDWILSIQVNALWSAEGSWEKDLFLLVISRFDTMTEKSHPS